MADKKNKPIMKSRHGRFQISVFEKERTIAQKGKGKGCLCEKTIKETRACVQHSVYANGEWKRQSIWVNPQELRDLVSALDGVQVEGETVSPSQAEKAVAEAVA